MEFRKHVNKIFANLHKTLKVLPRPNHFLWDRIILKVTSCGCFINHECSIILYPYHAFVLTLGRNRCFGGGVTQRWPRFLPSHRSVPEIGSKEMYRASQSRYDNHKSWMDYGSPFIVSLTGRNIRGKTSNIPHVRSASTPLLTLKYHDVSTNVGRNYMLGNDITGMPSFLYFWNYHEAFLPSWCKIRKYSF